MSIRESASHRPGAHCPPHLPVSGTAVVMVDRDGTVTSVSPEFERIAGYSRYEILGKPVDELAAGGRDPLFFRLIAECVVSGKSRSGILPGPRGDGRPGVGITVIHPVSDAVGNVSGYVAVNSPC